MANFYMKDIAAYRDATLLLSFEEKGYFDELLSLIYLYDGWLPDNDDLVCRAMPVNKKVHLRLKNKLIKEGLISMENGFYFNSRATQELLKINSKSTQNKVKADKRWSKSLKTKKTADATAYAKAIPIVKDESEREKNIKKEFDDWWSFYPRKVGKEAAWRKYHVARQKIDKKILIDGVKRFCKQSIDTDERFIPHPATWLSQGRWDDEYKPPRKAPMQG